MHMRNKFRFGAIPNDVPKAVSIGTILVWVQCKGYRCLAYADVTGKWINFYTGKVLTDFVEVIG